MTSVELLIAADHIPTSTTDALAAAGVATRRYTSVAPKAEMGRYVHWDPSRGELPVRGESVTASFDDIASADAALSGDVARELETLRSSADIVLGHPRIIVDGPVEPGMVKATYLFRRLEGMPLDDFREHWFGSHGPLWADVPGVKRYIQHHPLDPGSGVSQSLTTHDGWSDVWFADLDAYSRGLASPEREATSRDGQLMLDYTSMQIVVAFEVVALPV